VVRLARYCFNHRRVVLAVWLIALIGFYAIGGSAKAKYTNSFSLPGVDSTAALNVLKADFPAKSGDSEQIVLQAKQGTLRTPPVETAVTSMLAKVGRLPHVSQVISPYESVGQITKDGTIGFATVNLDESAQDAPKAAVARLISTAQAADSSQLNVQLNGQAIENHEQGGGSSGLFPRDHSCAGGSLFRLPSFRPRGVAPADFGPDGDRRGDRARGHPEPCHVHRILGTTGRHVGGARGGGRLLVVHRQPPSRRAIGRAHA
jgi:hypothetical protein